MYVTSKERWALALNGERTDRVPTFFSATPEAEKKMFAAMEAENFSQFADKLQIDKVLNIHPEYTGPALESGTTVFGARFEDIPYPGGSYTGIDGHCVHYPLSGFQSADEIEDNYQWPDPDWWDYSRLAEKIRGKEDWVIMGGGSEPFLDYREQLRGPEQAYIDMVENPEILNYCLNKLTGLHFEMTQRIYETLPGAVTGSWVAEDMGSQKGLLFSAEHIRQFLFPPMKRMIELVHGSGGAVFFHSDGDISAILDDLVYLGIDVLNPVQWRCPGMDRNVLKDKYASRLIFHGAMDNQYTLAFGSPGDVREEVFTNIELLGCNGGYILGPCHKIQVISPAENIAAMYEAVSTVQ